MSVFRPLTIFAPGVIPQLLDGGAVVVVVVGAGNDVVVVVGPGVVVVVVVVPGVVVVVVSGPPGLFSPPMPITTQSISTDLVNKKVELSQFDEML